MPDFKTGWLKDHFDPRDFKAKELLAASPLRAPLAVDLRSKMSKVEDQGSYSSCVANAVVGALEGIQLKAGVKRVRDLSRAFIYWNARLRDNLQNNDAGCYIRSAIKTLSEFGVVNERFCPYNDRNVFNQPDKQIYKQAARNLLTNYYSVDHTDEQSMLNILAQGYTIVFGMILVDKFLNIGMDGKFPDNYTSGKWVGAHAMLIVGYNETDFIVRNSWGYAWGDAGYFYLPRKFLSENPNWAADFWVVKGQDGTKYFDDIA